MADATITLQANAGDVPRTLGDLRTRLKDIRKEMNNLTLDSGAGFKKLRDEAKKLTTEINSLTKDPKQKSQFFDRLGSQAEKAALKFLSLKTIVQGFGKLFDEMSKNSEQLKQKMEAVDKASDGATGALGDFFATVDDSVGATARLTQELNKMANTLNDGTFIQRMQVLGKFLNPAYGLASLIGNDFGILDSSEPYNKEDVAKKQKAARDATLRLLNDELEKKKEFGKYLDDQIKKQNEAIEQVKEEAKEIQDLADEQKKFNDELDDSLGGPDRRAKEIADNEARRKQLKEQNEIDQENIKARIKAWEEESDKRIEADKREEEARTQGFIRSAGLYSNLLETAILNGGHAFERTFKAALAKIGLAAAFGGIGSLLGFGTFGKIFGSLSGLFAGGGEFYTKGPQMIMVGDNPGGVERVTVEPVSGKGRTRVLNSGALAMAGGGTISSVPPSSRSLVTRELVSLQIDSQDVDFSIRKNGKRRNDRRQGQ